MKGRRPTRRGDDVVVTWRKKGKLNLENTKRFSFTTARYLFNLHLFVGIKNDIFMKSLTRNPHRR